jgi:preprotein translocase subunit SecD
MIGTGVAGAAPAHTRGPEQVIYAIVGTPPATHARLTASASILQRRLRALGAKHAVVKVRKHRLVATSVRAAAADDAVVQPGRLTFRPVFAIVPPDSPAVRQQDGAVHPVLPAKANDGAAGLVSYAVGPPAVTNRAVESAKAQLSSDRPGWTVDLGLTHRGQAAFNRMARALYPRQPPQNAVALVIDGVVQSAPAFQTDNFSGDVSISGTFTEPEARNLAVTLRYGPLPLHLRRFTPSR